MTIPTLPLPNPVDLSFGSSKKTTAKILQAKFGDGYSQRSGDGLNAVSRAISVQIVNLTRYEAQQIDDFLVQQGGYRQFAYQGPGDLAPLTYICKEWTRTYVDALIETMAMTWEQVFN